MRSPASSDGGRVEAETAVSPRSDFPDDKEELEREEGEEGGDDVGVPSLLDFAAVEDRQETKLQGHILLTFPHVNAGHGQLRW